MTVLDLSVANVALPSIQTDLDVKAAALQWVVVIYGVLVAGCFAARSNGAVRGTPNGTPGGW